MWGKQSSETQVIHLGHYMETRTLSKGPKEVGGGHSCSFGPNGKRSFRELLHFYTFPFLYSKLRLLSHSVDLMVDNNLHLPTGKCLRCDSTWLYHCLPRTLGLWIHRDATYNSPQRQLLLPKSYL